MNNFSFRYSGCDDFGVIITCSIYDLNFAKGCIASVLHFMPTVPICVIYDGVLDEGEFGELAQRVLILDRARVRNAFLRERSFGFGVTKMVAFWESPFERFLLIDADTCVWGSMCPTSEDLRFDMVVDRPLYRQDIVGINHWFFDVEKLSRFDRQFPVMKYSDLFFCTGVVYSKREVFSLDWYKNLVEFGLRDKDVFKFGEMGLLNYMIFKSVELGLLDLKSREIQHIYPDFSMDDTRQKFPLIEGVPVVNEARVLHFCGPAKPWINRTDVYHEPLTFFRRAFYRAAFPGMTELDIRFAMHRDDLGRKVEKGLGWLRRKWQ